MSTHPSLSPTWQRPSVESLLRYLAAERNLGDPDNAPGLDRAAEIVRDLWRATEIATSAMNASINDVEDLISLKWDDDDSSAASL